MQPIHTWIYRVFLGPFSWHIELIPGERKYMWVRNSNTCYSSNADTNSFVRKYMNCGELKEYKPNA
jgi:hypothetical protein